MRRKGKRTACPQRSAFTAEMLFGILIVTVDGLWEYCSGQAWDVWGLRLVGGLLLAASATMSSVSPTRTVLVALLVVFGADLGGVEIYGFTVLVMLLVVEALVVAQCWPAAIIVSMLMILWCVRVHPMFTLGIGTGVELILAGVGLTLAVAIGIFRTKVDRERERFLRRNSEVARSLHDDVGSALSRIVLIGERDRGDTEVRVSGMVVEARRILASTADIIRTLERNDDKFSEDTKELLSVADIVKMFSLRAVNNGIRINWDVVSFGESLYVYKDAESVFFECLNNAEKYGSSEGGVSVRVYEEGGCISVQMANRALRRARVSKLGFGKGLGMMRGTIKRLGGDFYAGRRGDMWIVVFYIPVIEVQS